MSQPQLTFQRHDKGMFICKNFFGTLLAHVQSLLHHLQKDKQIRKHSADLSVLGILNKSAKTVP